MTQLRKHPDAISNYFDLLLSGLGARGSSFTNLDAVTHDGVSGRCLIQEFKQEGEPLSIRKRLTLAWLATRPLFTVWVVVKRNDGRIGIADARQLDAGEIITVAEYQSRFASWWGGTMPPYVPPAVLVSFWAEPPSAGPCPPDGLCEKCGRRAAVSPWKMWMCFGCHPMGTCAPRVLQP